MKVGCTGFIIGMGLCAMLCTVAIAPAAERIGYTVAGEGGGQRTGAVVAAPQKGEPRVVGTAAAIAVPNFITYRDQSRVAAGVGTGESIRLTTLPEFGDTLLGFTSPFTRSGIDTNMEPAPDDDADPTGLLGIPDIPSTP